MAVAGTSLKYAKCELLGKFGLVVVFEKIDYQILNDTPRPPDEVFRGLKYAFCELFCRRILQATTARPSIREMRIGVYTVF
jgi:hypothetical protein